MKKANTRLLVSLAALVMAIAIATTTTYAWFSMNTTTNVENIDLQVTTQDGVYMSTAVDGVFKKSLTAADLNAVKSFSDIRLKPLTAKNATAQTLVTDAGVAAAAGSYYEFDLFFRSASPYSIELDEMPKVTATKATNVNTKIPEWDDAAGKGAGWFTNNFANETSVANAVRMAFSSDKFASEANAKIMEPNALEGFSAAAMTAGGINAAHSYYKFINGAAPATLAELVTPVSTLTKGGTLAYKVLTTEMTATTAADFLNGVAEYAMYTKTGTDATATYTLVANPDATTPTIYFKLPISSAPIYSSTDAATYTVVPENGKVATAGVKFYSASNTNTVLTLAQAGGTGYYVGTLSVRIWAEGTDEDCFESILGDGLHTALNFTGTVGRVDPQYA